MIIATIIGAVFFFPSIALNVALACGAPLGMYAMNGRNKVVPKEVRKAFIVPICMQFVAMFVLLSAGRIIPEIIPLSRAYSHSSFRSTSRSIPPRCFSARAARNAW